MPGIGVHVDPGLGDVVGEKLFELLDDLFVGGLESDFARAEKPTAKHEVM